ncbi:MAG: hypothetical protein IIY07_05985, partial [Thermoguttaceae bacterium]|nr:hypothetical protein [Thermoguttaceae bacterium]
MEANGKGRETANEASAALNDEKKSRATRIWEGKKGEAESVLNTPAQARSVVANFKSWLEKFASPKIFSARPSAAFDGVKTLFRALEATFSGEYRGFSKKTLVALTAAKLRIAAALVVLLIGLTVKCSEKEVNEELMRFIIEVKDKVLPTSAISLIKYSQKWLNEYARPKLSEKT